MSLSASVIVRTEMVLEACLSILGYDPEQWALLTLDALVYWEGLLAVGEEDLGHFGIMSSVDTAEEALTYVKRGYVKAGLSYEELQQFARSLVQRYFVLGMDCYGELLLQAEEGGEYDGNFYEYDDEDED